VALAHEHQLSEQKAPEALSPVKSTHDPEDYSSRDSLLSVLFFIRLGVMMNVALLVSIFALLQGFITGALGRLFLASGFLLFFLTSRLLDAASLMVPPWLLGVFVAMFSGTRFTHLRSPSTASIVVLPVRVTTALE
jgi:hypothetical protein